MSIQKRLKALRGRFVGILSGLLGHPKVVQFFLRFLGGILLWITKLAITALLSYVGISVPLL